MEYLLVLYRVITILTVFLIVALLLSKRHLGRFNVFDFITAVTLGAVAGADMSDINAPHGPRIFALFMIGILHVLFTKLILENRKIGKYLTFDPTMVIQNGKIVVKNLERVRYSLDDLLCQLRQNGIFDLGEVEYAILEPYGKLSVLKKSQYLPVTPKDLNLPSEYKGLSTPLIIEGKINSDGLQSIGFTEPWLVDKLNNLGITGPGEVFLALLNTRGDLYVSKYAEPANVQKVSH
ncbi:DUF421 domain-containing protein [Thermincola ferriacetica]